MPESINDLYVSGIYSRVVDNNYLKDNPGVEDKAPNGIWKWVEFVGVGDASCDVY